MSNWHLIDKRTRLKQGFTHAHTACGLIGEFTGSPTVSDFMHIAARNRAWTARHPADKLTHCLRCERSLAKRTQSFRAKSYKHFRKGGHL